MGAPVDRMKTIKQPGNKKNANDIKNNQQADSVGNRRAAVAGRLNRF